MCCPLVLIHNGFVAELDMEAVGGSIPLATTNFLTDHPVASRDLRRNCACAR